MAKTVKYSQLIPRNELASAYIHWPFCNKICSYCNFNKYAKAGFSKSFDKMGTCLSTEGVWLLKSANVKKLTTIYFGGGTPSLMAPTVVKKIINDLLTHTGQTLSEIDEVTLEANPGDLTESLLNQFVEAGITRLSLGVQSLSDKDLLWMNRDHDSETALKLLRRLSTFDGLKSFSVDLIYGRPNQTSKDWENEITRLLETLPYLPHISLYELTLERGTKLWKEASVHQKVKLPSETEKADLYEATVGTLKSFGLHQYEVSNFSRTAETQGQHNLWYWRGGNFLGIGPGAHGRYHRASNDRLSTVNIPSPNDWMASVEATGRGLKRVERQSTFDVAAELLATSLRTVLGLESDNLTRVTASQLSVNDLVKGDPFCEAFVEKGTILVTDERLWLSEAGMSLADYVTPYLMANMRKKLGEKAP